MSSSSICDIEDDIREALKNFKFRKSQKNAALIIKIDKEKQKLRVDRQVEDIGIEVLQDILPDHEPRYVIYSYKMEHKDGRISYPICFIFYTPRGIQMELHVLYAGMKLMIQKEASLSKVFDVCELEELTEEWLKEKLDR